MGNRDRDEQPKRSEKERARTARLPSSLEVSPCRPCSVHLPSRLPPLRSTLSPPLGPLTTRRHLPRSLHRSPLLSAFIGFGAIAACHIFANACRGGEGGGGHSVDSTEVHVQHAPLRSGRSPALCQGEGAAGRAVHGPPR